jgi:glycosyltransferase involved in cell wall biosynthesis
MKPFLVPTHRAQSALAGMVGSGIPERRLKALQIVFSLDVGGLERFVINLAHAFRPYNIKPFVFCLSHEGDLIHQLPADTTTYIGNHRPEGKIVDWQTLRQIVHCIRSRDIDVIHSHSRKAYVYGALASLLTGRPLIISVHSLTPVSRRRAIFEELLLRRAHQIVSVSSDVTRRLWLECHVPPRKIGTIKNGIDTDTFRPIEPEEKSSIRRTLKLPMDGFIVGTVGRVVPVKNYPLLITAFSRLAATTDNTYLVIVGDGEQTKELVNLVRQLKLSDRVVLAGAQTNTLDWYHAFDSFVLSSISEGTPMALLEAGACGLPCVVTNVGGNVEVVKHHVNGLVVDSENVESMYSALGQLYKESSLTGKMRNEARCNIQNNYSLTVCAREHLRVYQHCLGVKALTNGSRVPRAASLMTSDATAASVRGQSISASEKEAFEDSSCHPEWLIR